VGSLFVFPTVVAGVSHARVADVRQAVVVKGGGLVDGGGWC